MALSGAVVAGAAGVHPVHQLGLRHRELDAGCGPLGTARRSHCRSLAGCGPAVAQMRRTIVPHCRISPADWARARRARVSPSDDRDASTEAPARAGTNPARAERRRRRAGPALRAAHSCAGRRALASVRDHGCVGDVSALFPADWHEMTSWMLPSCKGPFEWMHRSRYPDLTISNQNISTGRSPTSRRVSGTCRR